MFNTYHGGNVSNTVKINAVSGAILKNHPKSWFERFNLRSDRAKELFKEGGHEFWVYDDRRDKIGITVLQMVICGDMEVMAELVYTSDYNEVIINETKQHLEE
jgi:hypothetical protein